MAEFVQVAAKTDIPKGEGRTFEVGNKKIAVFNCNGTFYAIDDACKHQGGPLGEGELEGTVVSCPWHGWTYDVTSGESPDDPGCVIARFDVKIDGNAVWVAV